jgi:hypothetical protein
MNDDAAELALEDAIFKNEVFSPLLPTERCVILLFELLLLFVNKDAEAMLEFPLFAVFSKSLSLDDVRTILWACK